jgi:hypothetical protein
MALTSSLAVASSPVSRPTIPLRSRITADGLLLRPSWQVDGSVLQSMFSGGCDKQLELDSRGHSFLDFNGKIFSRLLDGLRGLRMATPDKPFVLEHIDPDMTAYFEALADYLGLTKVMFRCVCGVSGGRGFGPTVG